EEARQHRIVDGLRSPLVYLAPSESLSRRPFLPWLARQLWRQRGALARVARRRPRGLLRAAALAWREAWLTREPGRRAPRALLCKELSRALALAGALRRAGDVAPLHAHFSHGATTVAWLAAELLRLPFSFTAHAKDAHKGSLNPAGLLERKLRAC